MELVHSTKGLVSQSPKAAAVTIVSCAIAIAALALLLVGVGSSGKAATPVTAASGGLTPQEWRYVQAIEAMTPGQRVAAFGTGEAAQTSGQLTPVQLLEAYGTDARAAAALAPLRAKERFYVESIMTLTPTQLRAAFGTGH